MEKNYLEKLLENKDIIYDKDFFEDLKSTSLLEFRKKIQMVQSICPTLYLEEKVNRYYEELLRHYEEESSMFRDYYPLIKCFQEQRFDGLENYSDWNYLITEEMMVTLQDDWHYGDSMELAIQYLRQCTSYKISEIIIDGLFQDTIYNVWLNIKEMLRFHDGLKSHEKLLSKEKLKFYQDILNIDKMSSKDKILMYQEWKEKKVALTFYQDLLLVKRYSYSNMKKCLFQIDKSKRTCLDQEYFVDVYEFNGEDFYMLIRCLDAYCDSTFSRRDCYSLISSYHMEVFSKNKFIYGYTDFEIEDIFHVFEKDACSSEQWDDNTFTTKYVNRIMRPEQISDSAGYSEIQMVNRPISKNRYRSIRPNYLVVFDKIEEKHLKEANRLGIPIVKINTSKYLSKIMEGKKKRNDLGFEKFERIFDSYTNGYEFEKEKNSRR